MRPRMKNIFFNAQHSPIGAFASFTLGFKGASGGLGLELGKPADQNIYVGLESRTPGRFSCLPFFKRSGDDAMRFDVENQAVRSPVDLETFPDEAIARTYTPTLDRWMAVDLDFSVHTPVTPIPKPGTARVALSLAIVPALATEITVDNRRNKRARRMIFGFENNDHFRGMRRIEGSAHLPMSGIASGGSLAIVTDDPTVVVAQGFSPESILHEEAPGADKFGLGETGLLITVIPAQKRVTLRFVICFFKDGYATTGIKARYFYTRFFDDLEAVGAYALRNFVSLKKRGWAFGRRFDRTRLSETRKFMLAHAIHSYYGSTQLLEAGGEPLWVVNEGEYRMLNTLDLTVDQLFYEMRMNPWTVGNTLDWYASRYAYTDTVRLPGKTEEYPGGLCFTHDMGVANHFAAPGRSAYEKAGLRGCFSQMSQEELVNWTVCALVYAHRGNDEDWLRRNTPRFRRILASMLNRDHPLPARRDGVMSLDSSRCAGGAEITTYDSLDVSLGQARNNLYLAVKCWGVYVGLEALFLRLGDEKRSRIAARQAALAARTVAANASGEGLLPAILHENVSSRIIPAIEGLIIPHALGLSVALSEHGEYGALIRALKTHLAGVLRPEVCLFSDGAWKISSTSENSWLSKIYLCQFISERILHAVPAAEAARADESHAAWLLDPQNSYWAWSDQIVSGVAKGSKYYPRGVTASLWLD